MFGGMTWEAQLAYSLTQKRSISDIRAIIWSVEHLYTPYSIGTNCERKIKKEEKERKKKKTKFSHSNFSTLIRVNGTLGLCFTVE